MRVNSMDRYELIKVQNGNFMQVQHLLPELPNFHKSGSVIGMKRKYYGRDALLVSYGSYIYNVTAYPEIYEKAH